MAMPFTAQGLTKVTNSLSERPRSGPVLGLHQGDGHVDGVDSGVLADVIGHVLADADDGVAGADALGLGFAGEGAVGAEGYGEGGARKVDDAGRGVAQGRLRGGVAPGRRWRPG